MKEKAPAITTNTSTEDSPLQQIDVSFNQDGSKVVYALDAESDAFANANIDQQEEWARVAHGEESTPFDETQEANLARAKDIMGEKAEQARRGRRGARVINAARTLIGLNRSKKTAEVIDYSINEDMNVTVRRDEGTIKNLEKIASKPNKNETEAEKAQNILRALRHEDEQLANLRTEEEAASVEFRRVQEKREVAQEQFALTAEALSHRLARKMNYSFNRIPEVDVATIEEVDRLIEQHKAKQRNSKNSERYDEVESELRWLKHDIRQHNERTENLKQLIDTDIQIYEHKLRQIQERRSEVSSEIFNYVANLHEASPEDETK